MTEKERALELSRQIDRILAGKTPDPHLSTLDESAVQIARRLAQVLPPGEKHPREEIRQRLLTGSSPTNRLAPLGNLSNRVRHSIFIQITGWAVPALILITLLIYPVRMDPLQPVLDSNFHIPPASFQNELGPSGIPVTESTRSIKLPDPVPTPLAGSSHSISTLPTDQLTKPVTISIHPAHIQEQTPKPAPLATEGLEP
jgi:hypothetical protein